ncbi:unnamed protein product [Phaeothamnion confervicola]
MSFSPCALSLLPLTVGYIAGTEGEDDNSASRGAFLPSAAFAAGLAMALSVLGLAATLAGRIFGSAAGGGGGGEVGAFLLPLASSALAVAMGLNLLELLELRLPSFEAGVEGFAGLPRTGRAFLLGEESSSLLFGLLRNAV